MYTFNEQYNLAVRLSGVKTANTSDVSILKGFINQAHRYYLSRKPWYWMCDNFSFTTTAGQSVIKLPVDYRKLLFVKITVGGIDYIPKVIDSQRDFDLIRSTDTSTSDYPQYVHVRGTQILVHPPISSAGFSGTIEYQRKPIDMTADDYTTGTITSIASGDTTVTGDSTVWTTSMAGRYIRLTSEGQWYKIASVTSSTVLELDIPFEGLNIAAATEAYTIGEIPEIPEEYQDLIWLKALSQYYFLKTDLETAAQYTQFGDRLYRDFRLDYGTQSYDVVDRLSGSYRNPNSNPWNITVT